MGSTRSKPQELANGPAQGDLSARLPRALPVLEAFAARLVRGTPLAREAADLVQETLARALRGAATFDPTRPLEAWLQGICVRVAAERFVARKMAPQALLDQPAAPQDAPRLDSRDELVHLLGSLPERERAVLLEFHAQGRSIAEIARQRQVPEGTVKSWLHRARRTLQRGSNQP